MLIFQMFPAVLSLVALYALFDRLGQYVPFIATAPHIQLLGLSLLALRYLSTVTHLQRPNYLLKPSVTPKKELATARLEKTSKQNPRRTSDR
jgi:ABC-type maltose transport system permease subunit